MRLSKRIFATSMVILCVLIDTAVIPFEVANPVYYPKFTLLTIITIALLMGRTQGILYGLVGGVCMDISILIPVGLTSVLYTVTGFLAGYIGRKMRVRILSSIVAPIVSMMVYEIAMTIYYVSEGGMFDFDFETGELRIHDQLLVHKPGEVFNRRYTVLYNEDMEEVKNTPYELNHFAECILTGKTPETDGFSTMQVQKAIWKMIDADKHNVMADLKGIGFKK